jgi:hypothetical protein
MTGELEAFSSFEADGLRSAFDRLLGEHRREGGYHVPVSAKLASVRKPPR